VNIHSFVAPNSLARPTIGAKVSAHLTKQVGFLVRQGLSMPVLSLLAAGASWLAMSVPGMAGEPAVVNGVIAGIETEINGSDLALYGEDSPVLAVTTVEELSDVSPSDWAYQALRTLVEQYGCLEGYPDGTFRGNRSLSRFEFAAGLNACLDVMTSLVAIDQATPEELATLQRLQEEFATELVALRGRVGALEADTAELQAQQFSTTTKLRGEVVLSFEQLAGGEQPNGSGNPLPQSLTLGSRARLNFATSFTGKDLLQIRLDGLNPPVLNAPVTGTNMTRLAFDRTNRNDLDIGSFFYRFPVGDDFTVQIDAAKGTYSLNTLSTFNPGIASGISGAVSRFGRFNPIYYQGFPGIGVTGKYDFGDSVSLALGYLARENFATDPEIGLFGGGYAALAQLEVRPASGFNLGLTYAHAYYPTGAVAVAGGTGSRLANAPFGNLATAADHVGLESSVRLGPGAILSGWAGLSFANAEISRGAITEGDSATLFNWALTLGLPNLGGQGNLGGVILGQPPKVTANASGAVDGASTWHVETFYRYQLNQQVSLIPGFFVLVNPEHNSANDTIWLASFRTVFQF
jgi:hypothetical protein